MFLSVKNMLKNLISNVFPLLSQRQVCFLFIFKSSQVRKYGNVFQEISEKARWKITLECILTIEILH